MLMHARTSLIRKKPSGVVIGSGFNPADVNAYAAISGVNGTILNSTTEGNSAAARGTKSWATGKHFLEMVLTNTTVSIQIGAFLMDSSADVMATSAWVGMLCMENTQYIAIVGASGNFVMEAPAPVAGDTIGLGWNASTGQIVCSINGTYINSDGTLASTTPVTFHNLTYTAGTALFPLGYATSLTNDLVLRTNALNVPSTWTAWT